MKSTLNTNSKKILIKPVLGLGIIGLLSLNALQTFAQDSTKTVKKEIKNKYIKIQIYENGDTTTKEYDVAYPYNFNNGNKELEWIDEEIEESIKDVEEAIEEAQEEIKNVQLEIEAEEIERNRHNSESENDNEPKKPKKIKLVEQSWFVMDLGWNIWLTENNNPLPDAYSALELDRAKSANFHLGIIQQGINIYKGKLRFVYGAGIEFNNYRFKKNVDLTPDSKPLTYIVNPEIKYKKNKLVSQYVTMPLMLNFKSDPNNEDESFNIAAGIQLGYLISSNTKQKWTEGGKKQKNKTKADYNFEDYRMGYVFQFGYGDFNLYAKYYPTAVFKNNQGPVVNTASVGLVLTPF